MRINQNPKQNMAKNHRMIEIDSDEVSKLDMVAKKIIKLKTEKEDISVIDLVIGTGYGIYTIKKALA
ncbi:MAG: hypothetical protein ACTSRP_23040 [Candidatus Helarchaeota archaeon]